MEHVTKHLTPSSPVSENAQDSTRPAKVWVQLAEMFSNAFLRENGDEPPKLWQQAVWRLTDAQIATGLAELGNQGLSFPPNLSQFIKACKTPPKPGHWDTKKLPAPTIDEAKENADKAWEYMEYLAGHPLNRD